MNAEKSRKNFFDRDMCLLLVGGMSCIVLKLLNIFIFPWPNFVLLFVAPITIVLILVIGIKHRKGLLKNIKMILAMAFCIITVIVAFAPIQKQLDSTKYYLRKATYEIAAEQISEDISNMDDTLVGVYKPSEEFSKLSSDGKITYLKSGENIVVNFTSSNSFSAVNGFAYFKGDNAYDLLENPGKYDETFTAPKICEDYQVLDGPQWAYVEWFW